MSRSLPPNPKQFRNFAEWSEQLYEFLLAQARFSERNDPLPLLMPTRIQGILERASAPGILLFDATYDTPVVSVDGAWEPLRAAPLFSVEYSEAFNVNGQAITANGDKIPFNTALVDNASWASFDSVNSEFTLDRGVYYIEGYVSLSKVSGGSAKGFTGYLAASSDLTTPVGTVRMGTLYMPSSAAADETHVLPFRGQVTVPAGGETYAMVVNTASATCRFGTAHGLTGYSNVYGRLAITLIGLNE